ncbi:18904_t:CDS:2 [Gigaspora margarita]|uniref:18904_t:CDS:1 n=1 Tax=Gigaspora margarita TaxID=4874 RepID=A0ABN7VKB6_GIGMA|nr:18904_t:CDS:2 [Gigaspora margarita]
MAKTFELCYDSEIPNYKDGPHIECGHINKIGIKWNEKPNTTNNLEPACKSWNKKIKKLKITQKSKNEDLKELKKYE